MRSVSFAIAAVTVALGTGPGRSQDVPGPGCGPFTVESRVEVIRYVDLDPVGVSIGDYRVGRNGLFDTDGARVGEAFFTSTVIPSTRADVDMVLTNVVYDLASGTLSATVLAPLLDATDESRSTTGTAAMSITGGTQTFANAHGTATIAVDEAEVRTVAFDIACGY